VEKLSLQTVDRDGNCLFFPVEFTTDILLISKYNVNTVDVFKHFTVICPIFWKYISWLVYNRYSTEQDLPWNVDLVSQFGKKLSDCMNLEVPFRVHAA
jgi:hypothetical protein